jgi:hypothetical protein
MLEIKSYDDWTENQQELDEPATNLKKYTDYVRSSYYKAGQLNKDTEQEIRNGVEDRLRSDGLITEDMPEEDQNNLFSSVVGSSRNTDTDARFVLDHFRTESEDGVDVNDVRASTLANYLTMRERSPSEADGFKPYVDEILADKSLVKRARMSAVDRGEYSIAALDEEDGERTLYAGPNAQPDAIGGEISSLLATGAISSSDLYRVNDFVKSTNGGLSNGAKDSRFEAFSRSVADLAKTDKDFDKVIGSAAAALKEEKTAELRTTGEAILEGAKTVVTYPFIKGAELIADVFDGDEVQPKYAPDTKLSDVLASNPAFNKRFSAAEIEEYSDALTNKVAGAPYRADRPESGITTDSMGNLNIAPQLLYNTAQFEKAVALAPLNKDQQKQASVQRKLLAETGAPDMLRMVLEESPEAVGKYAKAKADGLSASEFLEQYVADTKNYDAFDTRLEQFGKGAWKTLAEFPLGIAALAGNEWAAKEMGDMMKDQTRRQEFSRLHGDEYGFGFQLLNVLPQVAVDIGLTIGTGGAFAGAKALAKTGAMSARSMIRSGAKMALSEVDDVAATSFRQAAEAGGEQYLGTALKEIGRSVGEKFGELAPLAAVTLTRSAGSAFGSIYNQLPDDMSHEEKYKTALPTALAMGVSTAVITVGLSGLGFAGTEAVATRAIRRLRGGETDAAVASGALKAAERAVPVGKMNYRQSKQAFEDVYNEGQILNDAAFNTAARAAITGTYKNWLKTTLKGGLSEKFEEALDTAVGMALEDAALDRDTPLSEKVAQVFNAGLIGGSLGAGIAGATQFGPIRKSEQSLVFEGRASAFEEIANRLRSVDSNATADVLQRRIEDERAKAKMSVEGDVAIQSALDKFQERTEAANRTEKPIDKSVFEQAFFSKPLQAPVWDAENNKWITPTEEQKPNEPLLVDLIGQRVSYGDFDGVLEEGPNKSVHLRLDKPYGKKGGQMVEIIDLGPRFQKASNLVTQEPTFLTTGEPIFDVPAGTPYVTQGRYKEKFAFPPKDKVTPESFKMEPDDEGNVRSIMIDGGQSLKSASVRMPIIITGDSRIQAVAKWYGLDIEPKLEITETPEGQFEFGFTNAKGTIKSKEEFGFGEGGGEPYLTDEELQAQTDDILGRSFAPAMEGEIELQSPSVQQIRVKKVLQQFDTQISSKQESLKKVIAAIESFVEPFKDIADKNLTDDQRFIKKQSIEREEQSTDLKKKLTKELSALKKAKKNYSEDTIQLGGTPTPTPSMEEMDRDWVSSLDQIKTNYSTTVDGPLDVNQLEDTILATRLSNKMGVRLSFSDVTDSQLDAIEQMANDVISYANDPENTASETTRKTTQGKYANLLGRVQIIQQYRAEFAAPSESEYKQIYKELRDAGFEVTLPEVQPEVASDLDTLHYLLSTKPQKVSPTKVTKSVASIDEKTGQPTSRRTEERDVGTVTIFPFANPTFIQQAKAQGVEINEARLTETQVVQIEGYDQDTREILYKGEGGITMRAPLSIVDLSPPTLREFIDAESKGVFDATQQAKRDAAAFKRRTSKPIQDRAIEFLTSVSNYVKKITELDARLEEATGRRPSSFVKNLKNQISEVKKQASAFINQKGGVLVDDIQFYQSLDDNGRQEIIDSVRTAIYGQGGYKSVAPRAKVYVLRPEAKIPTTKVELPKGEFRKGTQEEQLVQELIAGGFKVDLQGLGQRLALSRMFETESGMMKYPAFSGSIVENVQQAGQEVAETNSYIKNSNEFLEEEILKRYPQLGEFGYSSKAAKIKGKVSSVGDGDAMLASIQVELTNLDSRIATAQITGAPVPDSILEKRAVLAEQLKKYKTLLSEERYYKIGKKEYETRLSQQYTGVHYPIDEEVVQGETITFGVFTNNFEITRAQIAAGLRIRIPDSFDRDLFNPSQHKSKDGDMIDGYYLPYEQEPYMVGTTYRTSNPNIDENGEQVLDLRVTQNVLRKRLLVDRMVNPELMKVRVRDASGEERFRSSRFRDFYVAAMDAIVKRSRIVLESMAKNRNPRYPWTYIGMDNTISELSIGYTADLNEYRLAQHIVKKAMGSLNWKNLTNESMGRETLARFLEEEGGWKFEYEEVQDPDYVEGESRIKTGPRRRVVSSVTPSIEFGDLPDSIRRQIITEEGNITDKIKATNLSKFVVEMMDGDVDSIANDIKAAYKDIRGTDPHSVISEYARRLFVNATVVGGRFYSLPNYAGSDMIIKLKGVANKYAKAEQDAISRVSLDALPNLDGFDVESVVGAAGNDLFQAVLDHITSTRQKLGVAGVSDLFESAGELTGALTSSELAFVDRGALLADELYNTVQSDKAVGQAFRDIAEWVGLKKNELDNLSDTAVVSALAGKLNTDYVFHTNKGAARIALARLSQTEAGKEAAGLLITRGWLPPVLVDDRPVPLRAPAERESTVAAADTGRTPDANLIEMARRELGDNATEDQLNRKAREYMNEEAIEAGRQLRKAEASTREIIDYSNQYMDAVNKLLPSIKAMSQIKSRELAGIEEARADIYDSYRMIRALVGAMSPEEGGMVHTKTQKEIAEGIELGAPFVTSGEVNKFLSKEVAAIQAELTTLRDKRKKVEQLFEQDAPRMLERLNLILNGSPDFTRDENGKPVPVKGGGKPSLLETVKDKKKRRALLAEVRQLQEKSTAILTFGRETMDSLDASISVKEGQLQKAEARKNVATPVLLEELFTNISRAQNQIAMQREFISRLSSTARNRIIEEQKMINRLSSLPAWKRYSQTITGLPVVAKQDPARSEKTERLIDALNESAAARQKLQEFANRERRDLARALIDNGVNLHNSGLLTTYVDPVDVETEEQVGEPVDLRFGEGVFSEAERAASTTESFAAATEELTTTAQEKARAKLEGVDVPTREVGGQARVLSKPRAYDPNRLRTGDTPPELPEMEQFEGVDVSTREVGGRIKPLSKPRAYDPNDQFQSLSTLDPALRDEARAENIAEVQRLGLESGNPNSVVEALKVIAKTGSPRQRLVAELLSTAPDFIRNIRFAIVELDLGFAGLFDRDSNTVVVNLNEHNGRGLVDVLLHEYLHAPTVNVLLDPKTTAQRKAVARIEAIRNFAAANAARLGIDTEPAVRLGLQSNVEFLTYAFTAPDFQNILAGLTLPQQRSILRRIVDAVLSIFGLDPKKHMVAADAIQELFDFTKMSLAHSGTFSLDGKMRALSRSSRRDNERALAYSNLTSAELINNLVKEYEAGNLTGNTLFFSVSDVQKLNTPSGISLQSFAATFTQFIEPNTKTYKDVANLADDIIFDHIINSEKYIVKATEDGIAQMYRRFLIMPDGLTYDPDNIEHANASDRTIEIYNSISRGGFDGAVRMAVDKINEERARAIQDFAIYLEENTTPEGDPAPQPLYDSPEAAMLLIAASKYAVRTEPDPKADNGLKYRVIEMTSDDEQMPFVANGKVASDVIGYLKSGKGIKEAVKLSYIKQQNAAVEASKKFGTGWYVFKKSDQHEDAVKLNEACAGTSWCTGGHVSTAKSHLSGGDFHIYFDKGKPEIAIRTQDGKLAEPPRGNTPSQARTDKHENILQTYLTQSNTKIWGTEGFLDDKKLLDKITRDKGFSNFTDADLMSFPTERRSSNGYGSDASKWPKAIYSHLESEIKKRDSIYWLEGDMKSANGIRTAIGKIPIDAKYIYRPATDQLWSGPTLELIRFPYLIATNVSLSVSYDAFKYLANLVSARNITVVDFASSQREDNKIVELSNLESVKFLSFDTNSPNKTFVLPKLRYAKAVSASRATVELPALTDTWQLEVGRQGYLTAPELTNVEYITHAGGRGINLPKLLRADNIQVFRADGFNAPSLEEVDTLRVDEATVSLPNLTSASNIYGSVPNTKNVGGAVFNLPRLTSVNQMEEFFGGVHEFPELTTITYNLKRIVGTTMSFPKLTSIGGRIEEVDNKSVIEAPELTTVSDFDSHTPEEIDNAFSIMQGSVINAPKLKNNPRVKGKGKGKGKGKPAALGDLADEDTINLIRAERTGNATIDVLQEVKRITPSGVTLVEDEQLAGNMGARRSVPNTLFVNPNRLDELVGGLSRANAKSVVRTAVDEELAHLASYTVYTEEDFVQLADELGDEILNRTAHRMFETILPDYVERQDYITSELASGNLRRSDIAAEWVRSQITRMATGRTREADLAFLYTNPSLLERILVGLKEFIFKLKQLFKAEPTVGTAARISQASRAFRKLQNGGVLPIPEPSAANEYGDTTAFLNALAGDIVEGQEDRTHYMIAVAGTGASKTKIKGIWEKIQDKMYNLPSELRKLTNERSGYMSRTGYNIEDFDKQWPKMREAAIAAGFTVEELGMILGTTEPLVQGDARKEIQRKVRKFKEDNATDPDIEAKADAYEEQLWQPEADKFYAKFRKEQKAMEDKLRARGLGKQVDYLIEFRKQINKDSHAINLDANNDIYLTRSYRFLTTEGWAKAAKEGGVYEIDGKFVDFDKLRVAALKHFEYDVDFEAKQNGVTLTDDQRNIKLVEKLDAYLEDLVKRSEDAQKLGPLKALKKDLNRLLRKKDFDAPLRELLGEVTDPFENAVRTAFNVGRFAANERFLKGFAETAIENGLASRDRKPNMVMLFETNEVSAGELAGLYINKDIAAAVREEIGVNGMNMQSRSMEQINNIGRVLSKFSGLTVAAKTMGSVGYYPRNILGGMALTTAQGIINPVNFKQALRVSFSANMQWSKIKAGSVEEREEIRRLTELQVLKDDTQGRIAMDMLRGFSNSVDEQFEDLIDDIVEAQSTGNIGKIVKRFKQLKSEGSYVKGAFAAAEQGINPTLEFLAGLNNIIDSAFKVNAYYYELGVLQKAYGNSESNSKLEAESARKVKMSFPTQSDQIDFVKSFNKSPFAMLFMPFLRWKTEVIRTMINTPKLAMEEIKSGNAVMRNRGVQRLVGFTSTMFFGASVYGMIFSALFGMLTDDEDEEREGVRKLTDEELSALKEGLPEWQRAHGIFAQQLKDGSVQVIDMSNILPYSQVTDLSGLVMRGDIKGVAKYFSKEILGTQIAATATAELMNNRDSFNQPIWLETDSALQASIKMWKHLGSATLLPAVVLKGQQAFRAGEQNTKEILVGELTGARPIIHKLPDIEYRGLRRFKDTADSVVSMLYPLSSGKMIELDNVETVINDHQAAANKNQERMHNFFNGMKSLGSTEASLAATAKQMKFSKQRFGEALAGTNFPWVGNEQLFKKIYENKTRVGEQDPAEVVNKINEVILKNKADQYKVNFYR